MPLRVRRPPFRKRPRHVCRPPRPIVRKPNVARARLSPAVPLVLPRLDGTPRVRRDAFVDYSRVLTPEGGILITYKDFDRRWRITIWRVVAWSVMTGFEVWLVRNYSPVVSGWVNLACLLLVAVINWLIVRMPIEVPRSIEIRADCMIIECTDVFWLHKIETNWPTLQADKKDKDRHILCGIYGNRFVEYVTAHRIDELDRTPEVLATHLHDAMTKLWGDGASGPDTLGPSTPLGRGGFRQVY
jgi:hypothetical protein